MDGWLPITDSLALSYEIEWLCHFRIFSIYSIKENYIKVALKLWNQWLPHPPEWWLRCILWRKSPPVPEERIQGVKNYDTYSVEQGYYT